MPTPPEPATTLPDLVENHLAFMAAHRGTVHRSATAVELRGRADFLSWWSPLSDDAELPATAATVRLFPWNVGSWAERLHSLGFTPAGRLSYLTAPVTPGRPDIPAGVTITRVASDEDADAFADTQARGFLEPDDPGATWWRTTFREVARANWPDPAQTFYLLRLDGEAAAVSLALTTGATTGVYAVATPPAHRRRGYANLLLALARADAHDRGDTTLTLQVEAGSPAERLYLTAGFTPAFPSTVHHRRTP